MSSPPIPFGELLGLVIREQGDGRCIVELPANPQFGNRRGEVHGGALATLLDAAMARASRSTLAEGSMVATISITINFLAPGVGMLVGHGCVRRAGRTVIAVEGWVEDSGGCVVAQALGTFRAIAPRP